MRPMPSPCDLRSAAHPCRACAILSLVTLLHLTAQPRQLNLVSGGNRQALQRHSGCAHLAVQTRSSRPSWICSGVSRIAVPARLALEAMSVDSILEAGVPVSDADSVAVLADVVGANGSEPLCDPLSLLRFYNCRAQDVDKAAEMYRKTLSWRKEFGIQGIMAGYGASEEYSTSGARINDVTSWKYQLEPISPEAQLARRFALFKRLDVTSPSDGAPILLWRVGIIDFAGIVREGLVDILIRSFVAHLEDIMQSDRAASHEAGKLVRAHLIIDSGGFSITNLRFLPILIRIVGILEGHWPEIMATVTVVKAPFAAVQLFKVVRPFLSPLIQRKISILGKNFDKGLRAHSGFDDLSFLPPDLGGEAADAYGEVEAVPVGIGDEFRSKLS